jgi:TPR repeat protein
MSAAVVALRQILGSEPDQLEARTSLAQALYAMGDVDGALEELRAIVRRRPEATQARLMLATALTAKQDWPGARAELDELLRRQPDVLQAHYTLGLVRYTLGDLPGAIASYRRVLAGDADHADAHYNLALVLKLAHRDAEATGEFLAAARAGVPRAQYFLATAYATGAGIERSLPLAIDWWFRAGEQGVTQADEALAQLRQVALGRTRRSSSERAGAEEAFRDYRASLWKTYPELPPDGAGSVGARLLDLGRVPEAVSLLLREAAALGEPAQALLESVYEQGAGSELAAHDPRILAFLQAAAAEGQVRPRIALARIYGRGLGVPRDLDRAMGLLRATPHEDAQRLLQELTATTGSGSAAGRR